jgi:hypothetical protein
MPYDARHVQAQLDAIREAAPSIVQVRVDRCPPLDDVPMFECTLFRGTNRVMVRLLFAGGPPEVKAVSNLQQFLSISKERIDGVISAARSLAEANHVGTWMLDTNVANAPSISATGARGKPFDEREPADQFLADVVADLRESLPGVGFVRADARTEGSGNGHTRRRVALRFFSSDAVEVAAIDTAHLSTMLQTLLLGQPAEHRVRNQGRARMMAEQLGTPVGALPQVFHDLSLLAVGLGFGRIDLNSADATARFWADAARAAA